MSNESDEEEEEEQEELSVPEKIEISAPVLKEMIMLPMKPYKVDLLSVKRSAPAATPTFESLISHQTFSGNWTASVVPVLEKFFKDAPLTHPDYSEDIWVTLLAIYILTEVFDSQEGEWTMLAKKAKDYLKQQGVGKPDQLLRKMEFDLF